MTTTFEAVLLISFLSCVNEDNIWSNVVLCLPGIVVKFAVNSVRALCHTRSVSRKLKTTEFDFCF